MDVAPLPRAGIGSVIGLLEIIDDAGGKDDVFKLARGLQMELDDILPVIDAGKLLGLIEVKDGDVSLTQTGSSLLRSDVNGRKELLGTQLAKLKVFQQVMNVLKSKRNREVRRDYFVDLFEAKMSDDDAASLLKTIIDWGRYAELIGYDRNEDVLYLPEEESAPSRPER